MIFYSVGTYHIIPLVESLIVATGYNIPFALAVAAGSGRMSTTNL